MRNRNSVEDQELRFFYLVCIFVGVFTHFIKTSFAKNYIFVKIKYLGDWHKGTSDPFSPLL